MSFEKLNLHPLILKSISLHGYTAPSPIQEQAIPALMEGGDIMASAQTGTGKTAAFMLPALQRLSVPAQPGARGPRVLVLAPTRELAQQVAEAASRYGKFFNKLKVATLVGGVSYLIQNKQLSQNPDIVVATPGRLIDHLERRRVNLSGVEMLVLDEADRMLDMGFIGAVEQIVATTPTTRQTALFSATLEGDVARLARNILREPRLIQVATPRTRHEQIEQRLHYVDNLNHKNRLLDHLLSGNEVRRAIVFTSTKRDADTIADDLFARGYEAAALHGDMSQRDRNQTLTRLRHGRLKVLVATDVAARGLDVSDISHVINYDLPKSPEDYVHRIGRTGRAGATGVAVSLASGRDGMQLSRIERFLGQPIAAMVIPGLEPKLDHRRQGRSGPRPGAGKHFRSGYGQGTQGARGPSDRPRTPSDRPRSPSDRPRTPSSDRHRSPRSFGTASNRQSRDN